MESLIKSISEAYEAFKADAALQVEKTTKQQAHVPAKLLLRLKNS